MQVNNPKRTYQDESGQWWLKHGSIGARTRVEPRVCANCEIDFVPATVRAKNKPNSFCSRLCGTHYWHKNNKGAFAKENAPRWNGGKIRRRGYVLIHSPDHPACQGNTRKYVLEHRLVMEDHLGRFLNSKENVHHINGIKDDNRLENLELWGVPQPHGVRYDDPPHCKTCTCGH